MQLRKDVVSHVNTSQMLMQSVNARLFHFPIRPESESESIPQTNVFSCPSRSTKDKKCTEFRNNNEICRMIGKPDTTARSILRRFLCRCCWTHIRYVKKSLHRIAFPFHRRRFSILTRHELLQSMTFQSAPLFIHFSQLNLCKWTGYACLYAFFSCFCNKAVYCLHRPCMLHLVWWVSTCVERKREAFAVKNTCLNPPDLAWVKNRLDPWI